MIKRRYGFLWMVAPLVVTYTVFIAYPFFSSLVLSLFEWPGIGPKTYIGLDNFRNVLSGFMSREFFRAFRHNIVFFLLSWILSILPGYFLALCLYTSVRGSSFFKTVFFIPNTLSIIIVGFLWGLLLNPQWGAVNRFLAVFGIAGPAWLGDTKLALPVIIAVSCWRSMGFYILTFLAAILGVDRSMIEAAGVDGAKISTTALRIITPQIYPLLGTLTILLLIWNFNIFDIVFAMEGAQGGPAGSTDVLGTLFYRIAFGGLGSSNIGMGLGASVVTLIFLMVFPFSVLYVITVEKRSKVK